MVPRKVQHLAMTLRDSSRQGLKNPPYKFAYILHGPAPLPEALAEKCLPCLAKIPKKFARSPHAFPEAVAQNRSPGIDPKTLARLP